MNLDSMIVYLKESIQFETSQDIIDLPREEFTPYVDRCIKLVPKAAVPFVVLVMLEEERNSIFYKIKKFLRMVK